MAKLYFKFGAMGSSQTASALMCRFNYMQKGKNVLLIKPKIDNRVKESEVTSRIGLSAPCIAFEKDENLTKLFEEENAKQKVNVIICNEAQFCTKKQVEQLRDLAELVPVLCYGLKSNFKTELFEGSKRLLELADSIAEVKCVCDCGKKAIFNARFAKGLLVTDGNEVEIGGDDKYKALCWTCFQKEQQKAKIHDKIIKYQKIFKDKDDAGTWSSDTSLDNIILDKPFVIYDEDVQNFINDFKEFQIKDPEKVLVFDGKLDTLRKLPMKDASFDYVMTLISYVLRMEKTKPGILKTLIEDGTLPKWLKQIKKTTENM